MPTWNEITERILPTWAKNKTPHLNDDDGLMSPFPAAIERARKIVNELKNINHSTPDFAVSDGDGGIVFEFRCRALRIDMSIDIEHDGSAERLIFYADKLISREII